MKGYLKDIKSIATSNNEFRRVLYTARNCQLVVMSLKPQEDICAHALAALFHQYVTRDNRLVRMLPGKA